MRGSRSGKLNVAFPSLYGIQGFEIVEEKGLAGLGLRTSP